MLTGFCEHLVLGEDVECVRVGHVMLVLHGRSYSHEEHLLWIVCLGLLLPEYSLVLSIGARW